MIFPGVVVVTRGLNAAAAREAATFAQGLTPQQQRELQQATRELQQAAREAAQEAARQAREAARSGAAATAQAGGGQPGEAVTVTAETPGPVPKVTFSPDGKMTVISPDGSTTIVSPDGKTTHIGADGEVTTSGVPVPDDGPPKSIQDLIFGLFFTVAFIMVGLPISRAFGRRVDRNSAARLTGPASAEMNERMQRIEQAVEAVAIEVERVSEGQRFTTKLLSELRTPLSATVGEQRRA